MAIKMGNKMVLLCSTAIGLIYSAGYAVTDPLAVQNLLEAHTPTASSQVTHQVHHSGSHSMSNQQAMYRDGVYQGKARNHIGSVIVEVTIKGGKITTVQITHCTTSYSERDIEGLPAQVVQRQSANVDFVSGATKSSEDFQKAVQSALDKALNA